MPTKQIRKNSCCWLLHIWCAWCGSLVGRSESASIIALSLVLDFQEKACKYVQRISCTSEEKNVKTQKKKNGEKKEE